jgi:SAM-dependent methyltransferase
MDNIKKKTTVSLKNRIRLYFTERKKYKEYLKTQIDRSKSKYDIQSEMEIKRKKYFTNLLSLKVNLKNIKDAIVIGCRNTYELDLLKEKGVSNVDGIDLYSYNKQITVMDMHNLKFRDNSFDLIYCSHALEHAYDYNKAITEMIRVLRNQGIIAIEVPVNYETRGSDIHDFRNADNLLTIFNSYAKIKEVFLSICIEKNEPDNFGGTDIARVIFRIKKS